jgi:hypothetical protein
MWLHDFQGKYPPEHQVLTLSNFTGPELGYQVAQAGVQCRHFPRAAAYQDVPRRGSLQVRPLHSPLRLQPRAKPCGLDLCGPASLPRRPHIHDGPQVQAAH